MELREAAQGRTGLIAAHLECLALKDVDFSKYNLSDSNSRI